MPRVAALAETDSTRTVPPVAGGVPTKRYLTTPQASDHLKISVSTLTKWRLTGAGPRFIKLGSRVTYDEQDLDRFVAERVRRSTSDVAA